MIWGCPVNPDNPPPVFSGAHKEVIYLLFPVPVFFSLHSYVIGFVVVFFGSRAEVTVCQYLSCFLTLSSVLLQGIKFAKLLVVWFCFVCGSRAEVVYGNFMFPDSVERFTPGT